MANELLQRVGGWCEPIAYSRNTHHFRAEGPILVGSYVSRVKGNGLFLSLKVAFFRNLSGTAGIFSSQEKFFLGAFFVFI